MDGGEGGEVVKADKVLLYKICTLGWGGWWDTERRAGFDIRR